MKDWGQTNIETIISLKCFASFNNRTRSWKCIRRFQCLVLWIIDMCISFNFINLNAKCTSLVFWYCGWDSNPMDFVTFYAHLMQWNLFSFNRNLNLFAPNITVPCFRLFFAFRLPAGSSHNEIQYLMLLWMASNFNLHFHILYIICMLYGSCHAKYRSQ